MEIFGMCKVSIDPGICGFECEVEVRKQNNRKADVTIRSECPQLIELNAMLDSLDLRDVLMPPGNNIVFNLSEKANCHASCPVPLAILKCAEVEMGLAIPRDVSMNFTEF
jgi:hypothetical protein